MTGFTNICYERESNCYQSLVNNLEREGMFFIYDVTTIVP